MLQPVENCPIGATMGPQSSPERPHGDLFSHAFSVASTAQQRSNLVPVHVGVMDQISFTLWTEDELAEQIGVPIKSLQRWRSYGGGPAFVKIGRSVRYRPASVEAWLLEREVTRSSDLRKAS